MDQNNEVNNETTSTTPTVNDQTRANAVQTDGENQQRVNDEDDTLSADERLLARILPCLTAQIKSETDALHAKMDLLDKKLDQHYQQLSKQIDDRFRELRNTPLYFGAPLQQNTTPSTSQAVGPSATDRRIISPSTPEYTLSRKARTVIDVWEEYELGLNGHPAVKQLERNYSTRWRQAPTESRYFSRRKIIYNELEKIAAEHHMSLQNAAARLEDIRLQNHESLSDLITRLNDRNKSQQ